MTCSSSMPPMPFEYEGVDAAASFYAPIFTSGRQFHLVPTRANGQPAFGAYVTGTDGTRQPRVCSSSVSPATGSAR